MARVELRNLAVHFGPVAAVDDVSLTIDDGEFVVYLGPSGCGKTTTLRCIAGLESPTGGEILFDGQAVNALSASARNVAMVFQFIALYPHLKVRDNIAFPLKARGTPRREIARKLEWVSEIFAIGAVLDRYPASLPPGERQKVALARAVVREPAVLLLDEPLSAIDEQYREEMRWELGHLQRELHVTTIYVTHDQREAMSLADRIVLMDGGKLVQVDDPETLYDRPRNTFVGDFIGSPAMNFLDLERTDGGLRISGLGIVLDPARHRLPETVLRHDGNLKLGIRPDRVSLVDADADDRDRVEGVESFAVGRDRYFMVPAGTSRCQGLDRRTSETAAPALRLDPGAMMFFDSRTGERLALDDGAEG